MVARFGFEVAGEVQIARLFSRFADGVEDISDPLEEIADDFFEVEQRLFDSEGGTGGHGAWAPLSPAYARWKAKAFPGRKILVAENRMKQSLTTMTGDSVREIEQLELKVGTRIRSKRGFPYPVAHQAPQAGSSLPRRRPIDIAEGDKRDWTRFVQRYLVGLSRSGVRASRGESLRASAQSILQGFGAGGG